MPRLGLSGRFLLSHLLVVTIGLVTLVAAIGFVAPGTFEAAMGHAAGQGMAGMTDMMSALIRQAFDDALRSALLVAVGAAVIAAVVVGVALSSRLTRPIRQLAAASGRIADGRYAERVPAASADELGELARSFNRMAQSLESTEARRLQLVGDVAHELRTPVATLDGYLEGLQDGVVRPDPATWTLLRRETGRLTHLVDDLQALWRAEARQLTLSPSTVDLADELQGVRERFGAQALEHQIDLRVAISEGRVTVRADRERLRQVLDNFVTNAIRYSPPGAAVTLIARAHSAEVHVGVVDQGPGLTEDQRERVFERFYRVDPSRSRALGGSGIGLAITRALTEAMGGRVWAESEGPGYGSTFWAAFPRAKPNPENLTTT